MNGRTVLSKEQKKVLVNSFIERVNPYNPPKADFKVDLRAYSKYLYDNNLSGEDVTPEIMNMFVQRKC